MKCIGSEVRWVMVAHRVCKHSLFGRCGSLVVDDELLGVLVVCLLGGGVGARGGWTFWLGTSGRLFEVPRWMEQRQMHCFASCLSDRTGGMGGGVGGGGVWEEWWGGVGC